MDDFGLLLACTLLLVLPAYLLPTFVAYSRNHKNVLAVFLLNLFFGWLLVGWVGALIWAVLADQEAPRAGRYRRRVTVSGPTPFDHEPPPPAPVPVMTTVAYACPHCRRAVHVPPALVGSVVACAACARPFTATPAY